MKELNYKIGIYKLLKIVHPDAQLSKSALLLLNDMIIRLACKLITSSNKILKSVNKKLLSINDISTVIKIVLGDELSIIAIQEGKKAVNFYKTSRKNNKKNKAREKHASLYFKICTTHSLIKKYITNDNSVFEDATVFLTAVLEYIALEILELSGNHARDNKKIQITPRDIFVIIKNDVELKQLFKGYILGTGVINGGAPKMKKIKDNILGITKPGLQRLMYRAGVKYISGIIYEESRSILKTFLEKILYSTIMLTERKNHTTIMYEDGIEALNILNISVYNAKGYPGTMAPCKGSEKISKLFSRKKRKHKSKTNLLKVIETYQKTSCTLLPHESVSKVIREVGSYYNNQITRYESNYLWLIHAVIEDYMVSLYSKAILLASHTNRLTLMPKDLKLVQKIEDF